MSEPAALRLLVIEDDRDTRSNLTELLELDGYAVEAVGSVGEACRSTACEEVFAVILDRKLPDGTAEEFLPHLRELCPAAAVIVVTGYADVDGAIAALREGAADYVLKPIKP